MAKHYAKIEEGIVTKVIVAEAEFFNTFIDDSPGEWIETSFKIRKNFAGIGDTYDKTRDAFIGPQCYPSWSLNEETCIWQPPSACPDDGKNYYWDEPSTSWKLAT